MLVHISIDILCMSLSWHEIRYRAFHPATCSVSGLQLLSDDGGTRRGQLVPTAGAAADFPDQEGLVGDKGQVRSFPNGWCRQGNRRGGKSPCLEPRTAPCSVEIRYIPQVTQIRYVSNTLDMTMRPQCDSILVSTSYIGVVWQLCPKNTHKVTIILSKVPGEQRVLLAGPVPKQI